MKLTSKQIGITATAGITGMFAGVLLISGGVRIQLLSLAGLLALPPIAVGLIIADTRAQGKVNQAEAKVSDALRSLDGATIKLTASEEKEARLQLELAEVQTSLNRAKELLRACEVDRSQSAEVIGQQYVRIDELQAALALHQERVEALEAEVEAWEDEFHGKVDVEAEKRFQIAKVAEIKRIEGENDALTKEAIEIAKQYRQWANLADARLQDRREFVENITSSYNSKISDFGQSYSKQVTGYLDQIEILNCKVAALQQKLQGDLVQPEYGQFGYAVEGKIANDIARRIWEELQIPLSVKGYQVKPDGSVDVGYSYSRSIPVDALLGDLSRHSGDIAKSLGIHKITSIRKLEITDLVVLSFRREAAVREEEIKRLFTPIDKLVTQVLREMSRKSTIRIMGATGDGKGVCARLLLSRIVKKLDWYIRLHDPQDGSAEDHWGIPKVSTNGKEMKASLKAISAQMEEREISKIHTPVTLDILDEIDTQLEKDDKGQFLNLISRIRHLGMKMILIGQNPKVSRAGFQWADMEQMIAFYQGSSALDAIKNNPALELKREMLLKQYDEISTWMQTKNEWLDDAKKHYFGLCVIPGKSAQWYELPIADEIEIDSDSKLLGDSFEMPNSLKGFVENKNFAKSPGNTGKTNSNSNPSADAGSLTDKGMAGIDSTSDYVGVAGTTGTDDNPGKATCKKHPEGELRVQKDGRHYCPSCKKRLAKSDVEYR
jgi:hypothetical protein